MGNAAPCLEALASNPSGDGGTQGGTGADDSNPESIFSRSRAAGRIITVRAFVRTKLDKPFPQPAVRVLSFEQVDLLGIVLIDEGLHSRNGSVDREWIPQRRQCAEQPAGRPPKQCQARLQMLGEVLFKEVQVDLFRAKVMLRERTQFSVARHRQDAAVDPYGTQFARVATAHLTEEIGRQGQHRLAVECVQCMHLVKVSFMSCKKGFIQTAITLSRLRGSDRHQTICPDDSRPSLPTALAWTARPTSPSERAGSLEPCAPFAADGFRVCLLRGHVNHL